MHIRIGTLPLFVERGMAKRLFGIFSPPAGNPEHGLILLGDITVAPVHAQTKTASDDEIGRKAFRMEWRARLLRRFLEWVYNG